MSLVVIVLMIMVVGPWAYRLKLDYARDTGSHRVVKLLHALCMCTLLPWATTAYHVVSVLRRLARGQSSGLAETGLLVMAAIAYLVSVPLLFRLGSREESARRSAVWAFPLFAAVAGAQFGIAFFFEGDPPGVVEAVIGTVIGLVWVTPYLLPAVFYALPATRAFFSLGPLTAAHVTAALSPTVRDS